MSDVAAVAAITGAAGVLTSIVTGCTTWTASRHVARVELAKVNAENRRLKEVNREEERRNRQTTYHQFIDVINLVYQRLGAEISEQEQEEVCGEYNHLLSGVLIFGPPAVREGTYELNVVYRKIWPALAEFREKYPDRPYEEIWRDATGVLEEDFLNRAALLIDLMHEDVTRGITNPAEE